jgi:hypothetical protein
MTLRGSVLIVVLGLLAILAVVGITFVTMSSIDTSTAANFALQAQFDLAADAAVDYVCHALVQDVWEFDTSATTSTTYRKYTGRLLTGLIMQQPLIATEFWDYPNATSDPYLATNWAGSTAPTGAVYSFATTSPVTLFNLNNFGGTTLPAANDGPNNLGIPTGQEVKWNSPANGLWIPDLAFPYENGVIRVSVTVQDHGAMVNLNAHGNVQDNEVAQYWPYVAARGKGYFTSDVNPVVTGFLTTLNLKKLLLGDTASGVPGRWGDGVGAHTRGPGIQATGETLVQNPYHNGESPYTLDEEFELRRLTGTDATTRLESFASTGLDSTPASCTSTTVQNRLSLTTVGWTAEVRPYPLPTTNPTTPTSGSHEASQQLKADLNFDDPGVIQTALVDGRAFNATASPKTLGQFMANILAFRKRTPTFQTYSGYYGARRQPFFTKALAGASSSNPPQWPLKLEVFNPWPGDQAGDTGGIAWSQWRVVITCKDTQTLGDTGAKTKITIVINETATQKWAAKRAFVVDKTATDTTGKPLIIDGTSTNSTFGQEVTEIRLEAVTGGPPQGVDKIDPSVVSAGWRRKVGVYEEMRDPNADPASPTAITVLYVKDLAAGESAGSLNFGTVNPQEILKRDGIPIRFPHSVPDITEWDPKDLGKGPLPPYATDGRFKAFLRIGDLNQVLCPKDETEATNFWPWIGRIANKSITYQASEKETKFDWNDTTNPPGDPTKYTRMNAANVLTTERPWLDSYDNDGDGTKDQGTTAGYDMGTETQGRFCGPEIRVAGKINLNTATDKTLDAIDTSLGTGGAIKTAVKNLRSAGPIKSIAQLVGQITAGSGELGDAWGELEKRDLWFTRISNIATVRSDTFSIYGTVQFVEPPRTTAGPPVRIIKTRRFWALVDRSPSLAFSPVASNNRFLHPRIVNFQWMD